MHLRMAIGAVPTQQVGGRTRWWHTKTAFRIARMECRQVALLAQERCTRLQQRTLIGTMGLVAIAAILTGWCMFPQERSALFGMAQEALLIQGRLQQRGRPGTTVRRMAVGAHHLAGTDGMTGGEQGFCLRALVTGRTESCLSGLTQHGIHRRMYLVAAAAGDFGEFVRGTTPFMTSLAFMTAKAYRVTLRCRQPCIKDHCRRRPHAILHHEMRRAGTVTGLAACIVSRERRTWISHDAMCSMQNAVGGHNTLTAVTEQAGGGIIGHIAIGIVSRLGKCLTAQ